MLITDVRTTSMITLTERAAAPLTTLIVAPPGCGKSLAAEFLMRKLQCVDVLDSFGGPWPESLTPGTLVLTNSMPAYVPEDVRVLTFPEALCAIALQIERASALRAV